MDTPGTRGHSASPPPPLAPAPRELRQGLGVAVPVQPAAKAGAASLAEQELINSLGWLIRMRWLAAAAVVVATAVATHVVGVRVPERTAYLVGLAIFAYNLL